MTFLTAYKIFAALLLLFCLLLWWPLSAASRRVKKEIQELAKSGADCTGWYPEVLDEGVQRPEDARVGDILIAVTDGLKGMPEALAAVFPATTLQTCIVHLGQEAAGSGDPPDLHGCQRRGRAGRTGRL